MTDAKTAQTAEERMDAILGKTLCKTCHAPVSLHLWWELEICGKGDWLYPLQEVSK